MSYYFARKWRVNKRHLQTMAPGSIVQCRNREWVLLPSDQENLLLLRPLTGATDEVVAIHKGFTDLIG